MTTEHLLNVFTEQVKDIDKVPSEPMRNKRESKAWAVHRFLKRAGISNDVLNDIWKNITSND